MSKLTKNMSDQELFDALDADNDTGFSTEDLVKIVRIDQQHQWSEPMTADELLAEMRSWTGDENG